MNAQSDHDRIDMRALRLERNWSQVQMAEYPGCNQSTVSRIEAGDPPRGPILRLLQQLASSEAAA